MAKQKGTKDGRFVTLRSGQVIFIPKGKRSKWADVRRRIKAEEKVPEVPGMGEGPSSATKRRWEGAGLKPGDFGVDSWSEIDPEVVEDVMRKAGGKKAKTDGREEVKTGGRTYRLPKEVEPESD